MNSSQVYQYLKFSFSPASYIHPSWLESMQIDSVFSWGFSQPNKEKLLSEFLWEQDGLKTIDFEHFSEEEKTIFLLDAEKTKKLVFYLGLFFCQDLLKNQIMKNQVMKIKSNFGEHAYLFGLKKAPYMLKNREIAFPENKNSLDVIGEVIVYGMACLQIYLSSYADDIQKRVLWKLPNHWRGNDDVISSDNAAYLINTIIQEIE